MGARVQICVTGAQRFDYQAVSLPGAGVEVQDFAMPQVMDADCEARALAWADSLQGSDLCVSAHGAYVDLNPASPDSKIAAVTMDRYVQSIRAAEAIRAEYLVFHSQINPGIKDPKVKALKRDRQVPWWNSLLAKTRNDNLVLLLENFGEEDPADLLDLVQHINSTRVRVCLDVGHALSNSKMPLARWVETLAPVLDYVHLHWNDGTYDSHDRPEDRFLTEFGAMLRLHSLRPIIALEYNVGDIASEVIRVRDSFRL